MGRLGGIGSVTEHSVMLERTVVTLVVRRLQCAAMHGTRVTATHVGVTQQAQNVLLQCMVGISECRLWASC